MTLMTGLPGCDNSADSSGKKLMTSEAWKLLIYCCQIRYFLENENGPAPTVLLSLKKPRNHLLVCLFMYCRRKPLGNLLENGWQTLVWSVSQKTKVSLLLTLHNCDCIQMLSRIEHRYVWIWIEDVCYNET